MKTLHLIYACLLVSFVTQAQITVDTNGNVGVGTATPSEQLDVDGNTLVNGTISTATTANTRLQLAVHDWGRSHGLLFNSRYKDSLDAIMGATGNTLYANDPGIWSGGAGAIMFYGNGGDMDFMISPESTGANQDIDWGVPQMRIRRNGNIGIGTTNPLSRFHIVGGTGEQAQGQVHIVGNGESGPGDAYISFFEGGESNSKWSVGVKDNDNVFAISHGLTMDAEPRLVIKDDASGNVGIGTVNPDAKLAVKGDIHTQEVRVDLNGAVAPDFVFEPDYALRTLEATEAYIKINKHLPEIPSAAEMEKNGINLKEMNLKLLQKVEELTLYTIAQHKKIGEMRKEIESIKNK